MALQINSIEELKELLESTGLEISDLDELQQFLETVKDSLTDDPERRKQELAYKERLRTIEHTERMRAIELGHNPADAEAIQGQAAAIKRAATTAGWIGVLVPAGLAAAAGWTTTQILGSVEVAFQREALGIIWGVCGFVALVTVWLSFRTLGRTAARIEPPRPLPGRPAAGASNPRPAEATFDLEFTNKTS